jgi:hypothetical protein
MHIHAFPQKAVVQVKFLTRDAHFVIPGKTPLVPQLTSDAASLAQTAPGFLSTGV